MLCPSLQQADHNGLLGRAGEPGRERAGQASRAGIANTHDAVASTGFGNSRDGSRDGIEVGEGEGEGEGGGEGR